MLQFGVVGQAQVVMGELLGVVWCAQCDGSSVELIPSLLKPTSVLTFNRYQAASWVYSRGHTQVRSTAKPKSIASN